MREFLKIAAPSTLLAIVLFALLWWFVDPAPPKSITLASGSPGGAYDAVGEELKAWLEDEVGLEVRLVNTSGSVENVARLSARDTSGVDAALVQGGALERSSDGLISIAAVFFEPVWVFVRADQLVADLRDMQGLSVAIGPVGSGTRPLAQTLLRANGVRSEALWAPLGGKAAADALVTGDVDAAIFVTKPNAPFLRPVLEDPSIALMGFVRADAYGRNFRFLSAVTLPRGVIDLSADIPVEDERLIAAAASLVVRDDMHPAIQSLLAEASQVLFRDGDSLSEPGTFPSVSLTDVPVSREARRYFENGPSFLRRFMPFWTADLIERTWIFILPLITLMYPLIKAAPPLYRWNVRRKIYRWYEDLRALEDKARAEPSEGNRKSVQARLAALQAEVGRQPVPLAYTDELYHLRSHIDFVYRLVSDADFNLLTDEGRKDARA